MSGQIITIGRQFGSGGREIGETIARKLDIPCYDRELITMAAQQSGISEEVFEKADEKAGADGTGLSHRDSAAPAPSTTGQNPDTPAAHLDPTARTTPNRFSPIERKVILKLVAMCVLAYAGTFAVRFCFYCFHMTSGVV